MNIFDSDINGSYRYNVLHKKNDRLAINILEKDKNKIIQYFDNFNVNILSIDNMLDYAFCKYVVELRETSNKFIELKKAIINVISKFDKQNITDFIIDNYLKVYKLKIHEVYKNILIHLIIKEILTRKIGVDINKLVATYSLVIFDNENFLNEYKNVFWRKIAHKEFLKKILDYRYIAFLSYLRRNDYVFKESEKYDRVINLIIEYTLNDNNIYRKYNNVQQLIYFLDYMRDYRVEEIKEKQKIIKEEKDEDIQINGVKFDTTIDFSDMYKNFEKIVQTETLNEVQKICLIFVSRKNKKGKMAIEFINDIKAPITDILLGKRYHSYYRPFKKMIFESVYFQHEMNLFLNFYLKNVKYEELENLLANIMADIHNYILFEKNDKKYYKELAHNIVVTIERSKKEDKSKFDMYAGSVYLVSFLEKMLRELYIKVCLDRKAYIGMYTLKNIFEEETCTPLKILIGENLFLWMKYYLYHDEQIIKNVVIKEGMDIRNNLAHGIYDLTKDFSKEYYILLFITLNFLLALNINVLTYPSYKTENILKKIIKKLG